MRWDCKMFFGCDGIHQIDSINLYRDTFMFQSHIAGNWNDNVWNKENYNNFKNIIKYLKTKYTLSFKTMKEI